MQQKHVRLVFSCHKELNISDKRVKKIKTTLNQKVDLHILCTAKRPWIVLSMPS